MMGNKVIEDECNEESEKKDDDNDYNKGKLELEEIVKGGNELEQTFKIELNLKDNSFYNKSIKILLLGESKSGKTSFIRRLCFNDFTEDYNSTITVTLNDYFVKINGYIIRT